MPEPAPADALDRWLTAQARRESGALRLEDALLADRYARYFTYRLRYFVARTALAAVIHAIRVALLFGAFAPDEFLAVVVAGAAAAVIGDAWWGALERMRGRIRALQQAGTGHLAPREIASWLRLAARLTLLGVGLAGMAAAWAALASPGGLGPADTMVVAILAGAALELTVRTYHSGVYALRRVYRPLPSLVFADVAALVALVGLWPVLGAWAFPAAEVVALAAVMAISLRYTSRTYRTMGFPVLPALLRMDVRPPGRRVLRAAISPGVAYAFVGLEAMVLMAVAATAAPSSAAGDGSAQASLVALLAALGPVIRAGFEWARLLYFDLIRLGVPLLAGLRTRFDRAVARLALVMGLVTWLVAAVVGLVVLAIREPAPLLALLPFCVARSVLAAAQMRAFAGGAYRRLATVGVAGLLVFGIALIAIPDLVGRLLALAVALAGSAVLLRSLPGPSPTSDRVRPLAAWLAGLAGATGPVQVSRIQFDGRSLARGVPREQRAAEAWRRRQVGRRVGRWVLRAGGMATWLGETELAWWLPASATGPADRLDDSAWLARLTGGLAVAPPNVQAHPDGSTAARWTVADALGVDAEVMDPPIGELPETFAGRFPGGAVHRAGHAAPASLTALDSRQRAAVLRAGLRFAVEPEVRGRAVGAHDVSALATDGSLQLLFLVPLSAPVAARRAWRRALRERTLRAAAGIL